MWLMNRDTFELEHFNEAEVPHYLILSHTWGKEEVTFQDIQNLPKAKKMKGFGKINAMFLKNGPDVNRDEGFKEIQYAWIDTCCIDKKSSAELSEAVNSMYDWYRRAYTCIAYLEDLEPDLVPDKIRIERLRPCRWFTRGWTLQELISPSIVRFYDMDCNFCGKKENLISHLTEITGIDENTLRSASNLPNVLIARRMFWAARRETTRVEDRAYSLLGIFGIHMALIYGEREKAFLRSQEEIIHRTRDDLSLFAWSSREIYDSDGQIVNLLAKTPLAFADCGILERLQDSTIRPADLVLTNANFEICTALGLSGQKKMLLLNCRDEKDENSIVAIPVRKSADGYARNGKADLAILNCRELDFHPRVKIQLPKDVSGRKYQQISYRPSWRLFLTLNRSDMLRCSTNVQFYPKHKLSSSVNNVGEFHIPLNGEHFTGLMEIKLSPPVNDPRRTTEQQTVYAICGLAAAASPTPKSNQLWVTLITQDRVKSVPGLVESIKASVKGDHHPYYLSNIGHHFRTKHAEDPLSLNKAVGGPMAGQQICLRAKVDSLTDKLGNMVSASNEFCVGLEVEAEAALTNQIWGSKRQNNKLSAVCQSVDMDIVYEAVAVKTYFIDLLWGNKQGWSESNTTKNIYTSFCDET